MAAASSEPPDQLSYGQALAARQVYDQRVAALGGLFSDFELFGSFTAGTYVMRRKFIEEHSKAVQKFVSGVAKAIEWARTTPREQAVKYWKSTGIAGQGGLVHEADFQVWIDWLTNIGELKTGHWKPTDFFTNAFNPYRASE